jgi:hypothetical protein
MRFCSCFARVFVVFRRGLSWRFSFFSEISRFWGRINQPNLTMSGRYGRATPRVARKSALVERACTAVSGAVTGVWIAAVPHATYTATTEKRAGGLCGRGYSQPPRKRLYQKMARLFQRICGFAGGLPVCAEGFQEPEQLQFVRTACSY